MEIKRRASAVLYPEAFKHSVIKEYLITGLSKQTIQRKYDIKFKSAIVAWMKQYGYLDIHQKVSILRSSNQLELAKKHNPEHTSSKDDQSLKKRIKELEKQLEDEKIRTEMLSRMIDLAENELKVPIRKKSNTK